MAATANATVLKDFGRAVRDEPFFLVYKMKIWVEKDTVDPDEVIAWLRSRYVDRRTAHRYRVCTYTHKRGERYVDYILMESCDDNDLVYMKLRWGYSQTKVARGNRRHRKRLTKDQKARLDALIEQTREEFFNNL